MVVGCGSPVSTFKIIISQYEKIILRTMNPGVSFFISSRLGVHPLINLSDGGVVVYVVYGSSIDERRVCGFVLNESIQGPVEVVARRH